MTETPVPLPNPSERPKWASTAGILGVAFGVLGIMGAFQGYFYPKFIDANLERWKASLENLENPSKESNPNEPKIPEKYQYSKEEIQAKIQSFEEVTDEDKSWIKIIGSIRFPAGILYLLGGWLLLKSNPTGVPIYYFALGFSLIVGVLTLYQSLSSNAQMFSQMKYSGTFSIAIDIFLFHSIINGDKNALKKDSNSNQNPINPPAGEPPHGHVDGN